jgi:hypothetical protein
MKEELKKLEGKKLKYKATFSRFGKKMHHSEEQTVLLKDVYHGSILVADHIWADYSPDLLVLQHISRLSEGVILEFMAVARPYQKDRQFRATGLTHNLEMDSALTEIEKVTIIEPGSVVTSLISEIIIEYHIKYPRSWIAKVRNR